MADVIDIQSYETIEKDRIREIRRQKGGLRRFFDAPLRWLSPGVAYEARDDWLRLENHYDTIKARLLDSGASPETLHQLATANAYLEITRSTRDLAETWALVNQAGEILCKLGNDEEKTALVQRMENWRPLLDSRLDELYKNESVSKKMNETLNEQNDPGQCMAIYSQHWNLINQWISFSQRLWRFAARMLFISLTLAIITAEIISAPLGDDAKDSPVTSSINAETDSTPPGGKMESNSTVSNKKTPVTEHPYLSISLLGLFGGALSALLSASDRRVTAITYRQHRSQILIRLLLGASGAFVIYTLISTPNLFDVELVAFFQYKTEGFLALGVVAGFSEQLFKKTLENLAKKFPTSKLQTDK